MEESFIESPYNMEPVEQNYSEERFMHNDDNNALLEVLDETVNELGKDIILFPLKKKQTWYHLFDFIGNNRSGKECEKIVQDHDESRLSDCKEQFGSSISIHSDAGNFFVSLENLL